MAVNEHRVISRFLSHGPGVCEVKLYTQPPGDPVERYGDRIYLGRDCLPARLPPSPAPGPRLPAPVAARASGPAQGAWTSTRGPDERATLGREFLGDLREVIEEFFEKADAVLKGYPPEISSRALSPEALLDVNRALPRAQARPLRRRDRRPRDGGAAAEAGSDAARYVTKLRKDLTNDVNSILIKVNGRISDAVNGIHV